MDIETIIALTNGKRLNECKKTESDVMQVCCGDLMSDVLRFSQGANMLVTGLANVHAIRTAEMSGIGLILFVCGKSPVSEVLEEASRLGIAVLGTEMPMFDVCGILYKSVANIGERDIRF
jgi:hypothetical protein